METDTNPIDRSIAHLLFHRPSDPSMSLPNDTITFKSSAMVCFHEFLTRFDEVDCYCLVLALFSFIQLTDTRISEQFTSKD